jgi:two-component system phosphate regulon response regulator PhoB
MLLDLVWGARVYVESRTIDVHTRRQRKSFNVGGAPDMHTVRSTGYAVGAQDDPS